MKTLACAAVSALALALFAGCAGGPPKPKAMKASLVAAADLNPDSGGKPQPIVLRVYQLKEEGAFNNADYFALIDKEQQTLGPSLVAREEYDVQPGQTRTLDLKIAPEAHFIGATAGFRDIGNAKWRALVPVSKGKLTITIARAEVTLAAGK